METAISVMWVQCSPELERIASRLAAMGALHTAHHYPSTSAALAARADWTAQVCVLERSVPDPTILPFMRSAAKGINIARFIVVGEHDGRTAHEELLSGADGLVSSPPSEERVLDSIRRVARGDQSIPATVLRAWITHLRAWSAPIAHAGLTEREEQVLHLLAEGLTYKGIAERLFLSPFTVKNHVHHIVKKMGVRTRIDAVHRYLHCEAVGGRSSL